MKVELGLVAKNTVGPTKSGSIEGMLGSLLDPKWQIHHFFGSQMVEIQANNSEPFSDFHDTSALGLNE